MCITWMAQVSRRDPHAHQYIRDRFARHSPHDTHLAQYHNIYAHTHSHATRHSVALISNLSQSCRKPVRRMVASLTPPRSPAKSPAGTEFTHTAAAGLPTSAPTRPISSHLGPYCFEPKRRTCTALGHRLVSRVCDLHDRHVGAGRSATKRRRRRLEGAGAGRPASRKRLGRAETVAE